MTLDKLLLQVRRIAEHRELGAEKKIRAAYKQCLKELKQFIGYEYAALAENGKLTYDILAKKQEQTRFLEEVLQHIDRVAPEIRDEMTQLVSSVYNLSYNGMIEAAASSVPDEVSSALKGLSYVQPMQVKSGVDNTLINKIMLNDVLEKNRKGVIYDLKQAINIGITNGETVDMVAKRISKTLDGDYKKSIRVARTEVHRVREAGLNEGAKDFDTQLQEADTGMRMAKIWHTMKDNRVRPNVVRKSKKGTVTKMGHGANHQQMEGQTVLADEQFELSDGNMTDAPGQSGIASQDINCRCFVRYKLVTEEEYMHLIGKNFEGKMFTNADDSDIIKENSKKNITPITEKAIENVPMVSVSGYTDEQCKFIQQQHKELLKFAKNENESKEVAFAFRKGLTDRTEYKGSDDKLDFGAALLGKGSNLFIMHNHPRNGSYSDIDIVFLLSNDNVKTFSIIKNNGNVETLTKTGIYDKVTLIKDFKRQYKKYIKTGNDGEIDKAVRKFIDKNKEMIIWNKSV